MNFKDSLDKKEKRASQIQRLEMGILPSYIMDFYKNILAT